MPPFRARATPFRIELQQSRDRQRGFALLLVLWGVMILGIIAMTMLGGSRTSQRQAYSAIDQVRRTALEDAAIARAVAGIAAAGGQAAPTAPAGSAPSAPLTAPKLADRPHWRFDGTPHDIAFDNHAMVVSVQDEAGRVDLNTADRDTLIALLRGGGASGSDCSEIADHILDWRTDPKLAEKQGVFPLDDTASGGPVHARHGPLQSIDEVLLVDGMTPQLFAAIAPGITVYSGAKTINADTAPLMALLSLPGIDARKAADIIEARARGIPFAAGQAGPAAAGPIATPGATSALPATTTAAAASAPPAGTPITAGAKPDAAAPASPSGGQSAPAYMIMVRLPLDATRIAVRRDVVRVIGPTYPSFVVLKDEEWIERR